jgi:hypothetical protein
MPQDQVNETPDFVKIGEGLAAGASNVVTLTRWQTTFVTGARAAVAAFFGFILGFFGTIANWVARGLVEGENEAEGTLAELQATAVSDLFGVNINPGQLRSRGGGGSRGSAGDAMGAAIINALIPRPSSLEPSDAAAQRYVSAVTKFGLEGWLSGFTVEFLSSMWGPFGHLETFGELDDVLSQSLGFGRLSQRALRPYVDTLITTPTEWQINKLYRPKLLSPAEAVRQFQRGRMGAEQLVEELARQGYSDERIEALVNAARKFQTPSELYLLWRHEQIGRDEFIQILRDQGFEAADAEREFVLQRAQRIDSYQRSLSAVIVDAYANRRIDGGDFDRLLGGSVRDADERARARELGETRRTLNTRELSEADAREATLRGILSVIDYRHTLERLGYTGDAVAVKELLLRDEVRGREESERAKAELARVRAEEKAKRAADAAARRAALEAERAITEPSLSQAARFVVRGIWSTSQYADFLRAERYDEATIAAQLADVAIDRAEYERMLERRATVEGEAARKALSIAQLEAAVLRGVLSLADYRGAVAAAGFDGADVDVLARTLEDRLEERRALEARREQLGGADSQKGLSLAQAETAVLRGIGTLADFDAWLRGEGYPDFDRAVLLRLLEVKLADQVAATARRAQQEAEAARRRVPLAAIRRAVLLGLRSIETYEAGLVAAGLAAEERVLLADLLRAELALAAAAAAQRAEAAARRPARRLSLSKLEALVRADLLSPDDYRRELAADGWSSRDVELLTALLLERLAAERELENGTEGEAAGSVAPSLTLGELVRVVRAGVAPISLYQSALVERGYTDADIALLVGLLETQIAAAAAVDERKAAAEAESTAAAEAERRLADAVRDGTASLETYRAGLEAVGLDPIDAALLAAALGAALEDLVWAERRRAAVLARLPGFAESIQVRDDAYRAGTLTRAQYLAELAGLGLDVGDLVAFVLVAEATRAADAPAPPPVEGS